MCFDDQVLSAFYDGELEGAWNSRVSDHVRRCPVCSAKLDAMEKTDELILGISEPDYSVSQVKVQDRVYHFLSADKDFGFWYKKIYLPKPIFIAAAAVSLFVFGLGFFLFSYAFYGTGKDTLKISSIKTEMVSLDDVHFKNNVVEFTIQLPSDHKFQYLGEPRFFREVDYMKGQ